MGTVKGEVRAAAVQMDTTWLDTQANLGRMAKALEEIARRGGADLVVFPELASQGYVKGPSAPDYQSFAVQYRRAATKIPGPFTEGLGELARKHRCYIVSGMTEAHPTLAGNIYNSAVLVGPSGAVIGVHRKVHVPGHEKAYFHGGNTLEVYPTELGQIGMMVCADYAYPELARCLTMKGAEVICIPYACPSNPYPDMDIFNRMNSARAFENNNFVIGCNRVGVEDTNKFVGRSCICDPFGQYLTRAEGDWEETLIATLRREDMETARARFNRFRERRPDLYGVLTETFNDSWKHGS